MKHPLLTAALSVIFVLAALAAGQGHRKAALIGAAMSGATALASILAMGRFARGGSKPVQRALAVMTVGFFVRIVLVALGTFAVMRAGESMIAFVIAFFVPYFVFAVVEGAYVHSLNQGTGPIA